MTTKITTKVIGSQAVDTPNIKDGAVTTIKIADANITTAKYAAGSVDTTALGSLSISTAKIQALAVTNAKLADGAIDSRVLGSASIADSNITSVSSTKITGTFTSAQIGTQTIQTVHFAQGVVDSFSLADSGVITQKVSDHAITYVKIQNGTANALLINNSSGAVTSLTPGPESSLLTIFNGAPTWSASVIPTGFIGDYFGNGAPSGWVLANGGTVGSTTSGATTLASLQSQSLFIYLWSNFADSICPVIGGRGSSAIADWNANKAITIPDLRGRMTVGADSPTSPANRVQTATAPGGGSGNGATVGDVGGNENLTLDVTQVPAHKHLMFGINSSGGFNGFSPLSTTNSVIRNAASVVDQLQYSSTYAEPTAILTGTAGGSSGVTQPFNKMSPFLLVNKIIKL